MTVLVVTTLLPSRLPNGGELGTLRFVEALRQLTPVCLAGDSRPGDDTAARNGWVVLRNRRPEFSDAGATAILDTLGAAVLNEPISLRRVAARGWNSSVAALIQRTKPRAIVADHLHAAILLRKLDPDVPWGMLAHNIEADIYQSLAARERNALKRWMYLREQRLLGELERATARAARVRWTVTESDREKLIDDGCAPGRTHALPLYLRDEMLSSDLQRQRLVQAKPSYDVGLLGSWTWAANAEGLRWFVTDVVPLLPSHVRIAIAGRGADWLRNSDKRIDYFGFVDDVVDFYEKVKTIAVPVFSGGGIQEKTIEALGLGFPVVSTPFGARGITNPPDSLHIAPTASEFASTLVALGAANVSRSSAISAGAAWAETRRHQYRRQVEVGLRQLLNDGG